MAMAHLPAERRPTNDNAVEIHIHELSQLFNSSDPSPFYEKELDRNAEERIVQLAQELPGKSPKTLVIFLVNGSKTAEEERILGEAIRAHFTRGWLRLRRELRQLLRHGWISLGIGLIFLCICLIGAYIVSRLMGETPVWRLLQESLLIPGWVAMWRPLEVFLYDWWPILSQCRIYERLCWIDVRIMYADIK
jgi:hypothetical protein